MDCGKINCGKNIRHSERGEPREVHVVRSAAMSRRREPSPDGGKKKRSENYSPQESAALIREVLLRERQLFGEYGPHVTPQDRRDAWVAVQGRVNDVSNARRSVADVSSRTRLVAFLRSSSRSCFWKNFLISF